MQYGLSRGSWGREDVSGKTGETAVVELTVLS